MTLESSLGHLLKQALRRKLIETSSLFEHVFGGLGEHLGSYSHCRHQNSTEQSFYEFSNWQLPVLSSTPHSIGKNVDHNFCPTPFRQMLREGDIELRFRGRIICYSRCDAQSDPDMLHILLECRCFAVIRPDDDDAHLSSSVRPSASPEVSCQVITRILRDRFGLTPFKRFVNRK